VKYMILLSGSQRDYDAMAGKPPAGEPGWTGADFAALGTFMESFNRELAESGELVETRGLTAPAHGRRIRVQRGASVVTDGPYAESEEVLAGYLVVECASLDRARWRRRSSGRWSVATGTSIPPRTRRSTRPACRTSGTCTPRRIGSAAPDASCRGGPGTGRWRGPTGWS
jgi:hypothetical protein